MEIHEPHQPVDLSPALDLQFIEEHGTVLLSEKDTVIIRLDNCNPEVSHFRVHVYQRDLRMEPVVDLCFGPSVDDLRFSYCRNLRINAEVFGTWFDMVATISMSQTEQRKRAALKLWQSEIEELEDSL